MNIIIILNGLIERVKIILLIIIKSIKSRFLFSIEDVILNEERTTEQERRAIHEGKFYFFLNKIGHLKNKLARKYAQLKKTRHHRAGKQHSVDDDEEDIGMYRIILKS